MEATPRPASPKWVLALVILCCIALVLWLVVDLGAFWSAVRE
jgi:hypothetical protein